MNHISKYKIEYIFLIAISAFITLNIVNVKKKSDAFEQRMEKQKVERLKFEEEIRHTSEMINDINEDLDIINEDLDEITKLIKEMEW